MLGFKFCRLFLCRGTKLGISPLMLAAMNGHTTIVKLLIESNADVNQCIETNRNTALTLACFQGRTECVRVLVEKGSNLEWRSKVNSSVSLLVCLIDRLID